MTHNLVNDDLALFQVMTSYMPSEKGKMGVFFARKVDTGNVDTYLLLLAPQSSQDMAW